MLGRFCKFLLVFAVILLDASSDVASYKYGRNYDDSRWTFSRRYGGVEYDEDNAVKHNDVPTKIDIKMPDVSPPKPDTYFCTVAKMPEDDAFIVGYAPHAKMQTAHHMLMYGCDAVVDSNSKDHWECNEMGGICNGRVNKIMYAWAMDAPALDLPKDVGFHVGGSSRIKYIVLQVHYANVDKFKGGKKTDQSGVSLHLQSEKPKYFAGIYLVAAGGPSIPPHEKVFDMNAVCTYTVGPEIHPFAFRVHTHKLGYVVTGYRVRSGKWHLIGKGDPRRPQAFYHVDSKDSLLPGDSLAMRCTYNSMQRDQNTYIGATRADEMCNFYLMYWYDPAEGLSTDACAFADFPSSAYPADTDVPLPADKKMDMKRYMEDENRLAPPILEQKDWPEIQLHHNGLKVGQIAGVAVQSTGDVVIFHRADRKWDLNTFDRGDHLSLALRASAITEDPVWFLRKETGKISRTWGKGLFYFPHGITIDDENNMWFTDVGMHQVFKFSEEGELRLTLGEKFVPGRDDKHFCKPTDVAVEKDGSFFVSDGYCNSRIIRFSAAGKVMKIIDDHLLFQTPGFPSPRYFVIPHSLSLDHDGKVLYVADRENGRVLTFDSDTGRFMHRYTGFGDKVFAISYSPLRGGLLYVINGRGSSPDSFIYGSTFSLKTKKVIQQWKPKNEFSYPHDIACDASGKVVYVSEITLPGRLWKFQE